VPQYIAIQKYNNSDSMDSDSGLVSVNMYRGYFPQNKMTVRKIQGQYYIKLYINEEFRCKSL